MLNGALLVLRLLCPGKRPMFSEPETVLAWRFGAKGTGGSAWSVGKLQIRLMYLIRLM